MTYLATVPEHGRHTQAGKEDVLERYTLHGETHTHVTQIYQVKNLMR